MDELVQILRAQIEEHNIAHPRQKIAWELKEDKLKEIIKKQEYHKNLKNQEDINQIII